MSSFRFALIAGICAISMGIACGGAREPVKTLEPRIVEPTTTDNEVFYFPVTDDDYRASLSAFRKAHPELRCQYFGADDRVGHVEGHNRAFTRIVGHTIVCGERGKYAQDETVL